MSDDIHDALNELAQRGEPRGFDQVLAGATEYAASDAAKREAESDDLETIPFVTAEPTARGRRGRSLSSMIAAAGVAALVLVGAFAVSAVVGSGGAGSAEAAVRQLADAVSHEDLLTAANVLAPSEVRSLHGTLDDATKKAQDLQLVQSSGAPLAGVDFNIDNLKLSTEALGDGFAKVTIDSGTFSASTHKQQFSALMQKVLRDSHDNSSSSDLAKLAAGQNLPTFLMVVRQEGRWYVSAAYTVLEYIREGNDLPAADFGSGLKAVSTLGADTPDAAVQDSLRALAGRDWSKLITMVSPDEIPVYDYRAALTTLAQRNDSSGSAPSSFTIDSMSTTSHVDGDTAKVSLKASGTTDSGKWSLDGGCFTPPAGQVAFTCSDSNVGRVDLIFGGVDQSSQFTVINKHGRWFVSPVGTVLDALDHFISQIDRRTLFTLLGIPNQLPPDGHLTLGRPVVLNAANKHLQVLTYEGHQGETFLGQATQQPATGAGSVKGLDYNTPANVRVFGPDGSEIDQGSGLLFGQPLALPTDGTYTFVEAGFGFVNGGDVTVTIWDAAHAPASAKELGGGMCYVNGGGMASGNSTSCSSSVTPTTVGSPRGPVITPGETCTSSGGAPTCTSQIIGPNGELLGPDGTPVTNPDGTPMTVPAALRDQIKQAGQNGGGSYSSGSASGNASVVAPTDAVAVTTATGG